jgi:MraZ protein
MGANGVGGMIDGSPTPMLPQSLYATPIPPQGFYSGKLDDRMRLKIPSEWARYFDCLRDKRLFCTSLDGRIARIYPIEVWMENVNLLDNYTEDPDVAETVIFTANRYGGTVEMDNQSRIVLPQRLRELLQLAEGQTLHIYASKGHAEVLTNAVFEEESGVRTPVAAEAMRKLKQAGLK